MPPVPKEYPPQEGAPITVPRQTLRGGGQPHRQAFPGMAGPGAQDAAAARRLHRKLNARPARRGGHRVREEAAAGGRGGGQGVAAVKEEEGEEEEVKIRLLEMVKEEEVD